MQELASHAEQLRQTFGAITASYAESPGPFPERLHIGSLIGRFLFEYAQTLAEWSAWAEAHIAQWPETGPGAAASGERVQRENERLAGLPENKR